jgi:hypothetical protein
MKKDGTTQTDGKKKLTLRKDSIRALDNADLSLIGGGDGIPPDAGAPPKPPS